MSEWYCMSRDLGRIEVWAGVEVVWGGWRCGQEWE